MSLEDFKGLLEKNQEQLSFDYSNKQLIGIFLLIALLAGGGFIYYRQSRPVQVKEDVFEIHKEEPQATKNERSTSKDLIIHVCGAVNRAGVFTLREGSRIVDAIECAGGVTAEANVDALNLAAKLTDGTRIYVPRHGEQSSGQPWTGPLQGSTDPEGQPPLVNLNNAPADQLETLPGVGEVLAQRIIEYRDEKGAFSSVEQLRNVEGIGPKKFEQLKDRVSVD